MINKRQFIRHPSSIPIQVKLKKHANHSSCCDINERGLSFESENALPVDTIIEVTISHTNPGFSAQGIVRWCNAVKDHYQMGVAFTEPSTAYAIKMVEQVCHIESYRHKLQQRTGLKISSAQAAVRWIKKYAEKFSREHD